MREKGLPRMGGRLLRTLLRWRAVGLGLEVSSNGSWSKEPTAVIMDAPRLGGRCNG